MVGDIRDKHTQTTCTGHGHGHGVALGSSTPKPPWSWSRRGAGGVKPPQTPGAEGGIGIKSDGAGQRVAGDIRDEHF